MADPFPVEYMVIADTNYDDGRKEVSFYWEMAPALEDGELANGRVFEVRKIADFGE